MRRTKKEMKLLRIECSYYLGKVKNDPYLAFEMMINDFVKKRKNIPYYIEGINDFKKISKEIEKNLK